MQMGLLLQQGQLLLDQSVHLSLEDKGDSGRVKSSPFFMIYLILITVVGINIAPFFTAKNPLFFWNAQGLWVQVGVLICFSWSFIENTKFKSPRNIPLGLLHLWVGLLTALACFIVQARGSYDVKPLLPYFNFLCLIMLYRLIVQYLNKDNIMLMYQALRYSIMVTLILCGLQFLGLSQYFKLIYPDYQAGQFVNNVVSGFIGNGTHLSGFLAMCIPLFLYERKSENVVALVLLGIIVFFLSGQTKGDIPISGILVILSVIFYLIWSKSKSWFWSLLCLGILSGVIVYLVVPIEKYGMFFHSQGRFGWWKDFLKLSQASFLTGSGYGSVFWIGIKSKYPLHLHNEYIQFLYEGGLIGLILAINVIIEFFKIKVGKLGTMYKAIFLGFLVSSIFNYPMHLWLPASYACVCYAMAVALKEREVKIVGYKKANKGFGFSNNQTKCCTDR